jgi:hypothetical protein
VAKVCLGVAVYVIVMLFPGEATGRKLTTWSRVLPEKVRGLQLVKKFTAFYGT